MSLFVSLHAKLDFLPDNIFLASTGAVPKCAGFWGSIIGRPLNRWAWLWRKSRLKIIENRKNDLLRLILHRAIRVRYLLKRWGCIESNKCATCSGAESIEHCFLDFPTVVKVLDFFAPYLEKLLDHFFSVTSTSIFFPLSTDVSSPGVSLSSYLIATILYWVWHARGLSTFHNSKIGSQQIIS